MDALERIAALSARERARIDGRGREEGDMADPVDKVAALRDATAALDAAGAAYALVGGVAVGLRSGVARATMDTDFAVRSTVGRRIVVEALTRAGFVPRGEFSHSVNFRHASGEPVQIVLDPGFDAMIDRAETLQLAGVRVRVVTTPDLIAMKERAARDPARRRSKALRDQADVALLRGDVPDPDEGW